MISIKMRTAIFTIAFLLTVGGFAYFYRTNIKSYFRPTIEQIGNIHIKIENDTCYLHSNLSIHNKSFLDIKIDSLKYEVSLFDKVYLESNELIGITLKGKTDDTIGFSIKIPYKILMKDLKSERKKGDSASYAIDLSIQYATFLGKSEMPINKTAKIKIPQPPEIEVLDIQYKKVRFKSIQADVRIKVINYTNVNLTIKKMNYSIDVTKQGNINGNYSGDINIKPNGATIILLPIEITPRNIARTFFDVIINKDYYDYKLTLNAVLESTDPVNESFPIDLVTIGTMELKK